MDKTIKVRRKGGVSKDLLAKEAKLDFGDDGKAPRQPLVNRLTGKLAGPRVAHMNLATTAIVGHLEVAGSSLWAWYELTPLQWSFRTADKRAQVWDNVRQGLAQLSGHAIKWRVSSKPFPTYEFARKLAHATPNPLPPNEAGDFDLFLERQQQRLNTAPVDENVTMIGVRVGPAPAQRTLRRLYAAETSSEPISDDVVKLLEQVKKVNELVAATDLGGRPLTPEQMAWLRHRSIAMGMPVQLPVSPVQPIWETDDLYAFSDPVDWVYKPMGSTVKIQAKIAGREVTRYVAVVSVGRMPDRMFPEDGRSPWMLATSRLAYPVEWSVTGVLLGADTLTSVADYERRRAQGIKKHYEDHDEMPPPAVDRAISQAVLSYDEITEGDNRTAVRFQGPIRAAVFADTEERCLERVRDLIAVYGRDHHIELVHGSGQAQLLREFIPGEPWSTTGFQRRMSVGYLAAAMPHVSSTLGTPTGPYTGYTVGTARRAVLFDGHFSMEVLNAPGVFPLVSDPGGGKSHAVGSMAATDVELGDYVIVLDPSGPLARLTELPRFKPHSRLLNLTESHPGTLAPWQLVPEPRRDKADNDREYDQMVRRASQERKQLAYDSFRMMMPESMLRDRAVDDVLHKAIRHLGGDVTVNASDIFDVLNGLGEDGRRVAERLHDARQFPLGELLFPEDGQLDLGIQAQDKRLVVITMPGMVVPDPDLGREQWSVEELYAQPLLHLAAFYTSRFIYSRPVNDRVDAYFDENHFMGRWGSGRALGVRLGRDSRKFNAKVVPASQNPDDILAVGPIASLIGGAFVGRIEDLQTAQNAMRLVRAPEEYAPVVQGLSPKPAPGDPVDIARTGEFLFLDPYGRIDKMRFDASWYPELEAALNTTPGHRRIRAGNEMPSPFIDEARDLFRLDEGLAA